VAADTVRSPTGFADGLRLLLRPKLLSARRRSASGHSRLGRAALVFVIGLAAWPLVYLAFYRLLSALRVVEEVGPLLASKILGVGFLVFFGILLLSNLIAALSSFFLSRDLPYLQTTPVDWLSLYAARLAETLVSSSWMVLLMLVPILAAYDRVFGGGIAFYGLALIVIIPFLVIPAAVGSAGTLILVRVFPARRSKDILGIISMAAVALLVLGLRILRPERLVNPEAYRNLVDFLAALRSPSSPWLPSQWSADLLFGNVSGATDLFLLVLLWTTAGALVVVGAWLHRSMYGTCFTKAQEGAENRIQKNLAWVWFERMLAPLGLVRRELVLKDIRVFFRDTTQWSQLIILAVLVVVYVYNIRVLPIRGESAVTGYLVTIIVFLNLALAGFVLAAIAARFVFPAISLEGRTLWLLRSSPVTARDLLWSKFVVGVVPLAVLALLLTGLTNLFLGVSAGLLVLSLLSILCISLAFTSQGLAWGVYYPEFESENAAQIPTSVGGLLFMLGALASLTVVVGIQLWTLGGYLESGLPGREARDPFAGELLLAAALTVGFALLATLLPYRVAVRKLENLDRG
jgi:ABC-2 type transport system permease protein